MCCHSLLQIALRISGGKWAQCGRKIAYLDYCVWISEFRLGFAHFSRCVSTARVATAISLIYIYIYICKYLFVFLLLALPICRWLVT